MIGLVVLSLSRTSGNLKGGQVMDKKTERAIFLAVLEGKPYYDRLSKKIVDSLLEENAKVFTSVVSEIDALENISEVTRTKRQSKFSGEVLGRLYHTHYSTSDDIAQNIELHWGRPDLQEDPSHPNTLLRNAIEADLQHNEMWSEAGVIAKKIVSGYDERRAKRKISGEWIIYGVHEGLKYYLDLGYQGELIDEVALYDRVYSSCPEFDFCFH